jgi:RNA polymerase sigma-70 factor (ECF subfamily)
METEAFERAVLQHKDRVHAYAVMMLRDAEEARDVAQEALVKLWKHWDRVDAAGTRAWLMRATHNMCIDRIRRRKVRSEVDGEEIIPMQADEAPGPKQLAHSSELGRAIERALERLSPDDRAVIVLREVQGLPYGEIAEALNMPLGTLKARLHRARERLRTRLVRAGVTP